MRRFTARMALGLALLGLAASPRWSAGQVFQFEAGGKDKKAAARARAGLKLAVKLASSLPKLQERFEQRRRSLAETPGPSYPRREVVALLDTTESQVLRSFKGRELDPLRGYVAEVFQGARDGLGPTAGAARRAPTSPAATFASLRPAQPARRAQAGPDAAVNRDTGERVLAGIASFLGELVDRARRKDYNVDLCVLSDPRAGARVTLQIRGYREEYQSKTNSRLASLVRGKYVYDVKRRDFPAIDCRTSPDCLPVNLWSVRQPVLDCDLSDGSCLTPGARPRRGS